MSYGLRIRLEHHDFLGKLSTIDISERDYTGAYITRTLEGASPLQTTWGDTSNPLPCIYGSEAIIKFYAESDFEFLFLFTSDARKYKVTHTYDGALDWSGFIAPENWNEPLIAANYCVEATAVDGLGNLKNEIYPEPPAEESRKTLLEIIATILQQTGLNLPINTCVEWEESAQATGADPLDVHYRKTQPLANQNSYELLEQLLPKCRVFQRLGQWWIIGYNSFQMPTISYHRYAYDGTVLSPATATISVRAADYWIEGEPQLEILPACKQQIAIQDYGYTDNLINNGDFEIFNQESETFKNWTNNGGILPEQHDLDNEGNKYCYLPGKQYPGTLEAFGYGDMTQSISRIIKISAAASTFKISFKYALMGASYSCPLFMRVRIVGSTQTYYLRRYPYTANTDPLFTWKLQPASPDLGDDRITIASTRKKTNQIFDNIDGVYTNVEGKYYNTFDYVPAWKWDIIPDHFEDFSATVEGLPISGNLEVTLYVAFTNRVQIAGACYHSVKLELLNEETLHYPLQRSFKIINDPNNTYKPDDETYTIGDYPDMPNADIIYNNGLSRADETYTSAWTIPGSIATYTFVEMLGRLGVNLMGAPRQQYNIRLMYMVPTLAIIIPDILEEGLYFIENGITYDNRMGAVEGTYIQMPEIYIDGFTVETAEEFDEKTGKPTTTNQKVTTGTQTPLNVDKKVSLIDIENVLVTPYGYFDADWFIHITDIDYGVTRFRPYQADWTQDDPASPDYIKNKPADTSGYTLPVATASILGGVKIGSGVSVTGDGTISVATNYQAPLSGTGFVKISGTTISYDNSTFDNYSGWMLGTGSTYRKVEKDNYINFTAGTNITIADNGVAGTFATPRTITISASGGTMVYPGAGLAKSTGSAWATSITDNSSNWNTAYGWGNHAGLYAPIAHVGATGTAHGNATALVAGFMTASDFTKLEGIETGATNYSFNIQANSGTTAAIAKGNTVTFSQGSNISISRSGNTLTFSASYTPSMIYPGAGIAVSTGSSWGTSIVDNSANWNEAYSNMGKVAFHDNTTLIGYLNSTNFSIVGGVISLQLKTINSTSLIGIGNLSLQPTLISGTNIKTINGSTILGSGDITVTGTNYWQTGSGWIAPATITDQVRIGSTTSIGGQLFQVTGDGRFAGSLYIYPTSTSNNGFEINVTTSARAANIMNWGGYGIVVGSIGAAAIQAQAQYSNTNASQCAIEASRFTTGTPANGIGVHIAFTTNNATSNTSNIEYGRFGLVSTAITSANESGSFVWQLKNGGTLAEKMTLTKDGLLSTVGGLVSSGGGVGYSTGAGGTQTQGTSKATGVTLNTLCGRITTFSAALAAAAEATFTVTNSKVEAGDLVIVNHVSGGTNGAYLVQVSNVSAGSFAITYSNVSTASKTESPVIGFAIIKGVTS